MSRSARRASTASSRRHFLRTAAATAGTGFGFWVAGQGGLAQADESAARVDESALTTVSPNEKLNVGIVGVAGRGAANLEELSAIPLVNLAALCDVDENRSAEAAARFPKARKYNDFRKMLDEGKDLDAVVVCTADHTHVPTSLMALNLGKHVYCEKPLSHNVYESRLAAEAAARNKRVTQLGTQIHASGNYRRVVELIQGGVIGDVSEVHVFIDKMWSPANDPPRREQPAPAGLNWDAWLGPAPEQPYRTNTLPANWRKWWDFGNGTLGDMGCHYMDLPFWALKLRYPTRVSAAGAPLVYPDGTPAWVRVRYEFPARGNMPPVEMTWYDGGKKPPARDIWKLSPEVRNGVLFVGDKGQLFADYNQHNLFPEEQFADFKPPAPTIPESIGHHNEWVRACLANDPSAASCNFDYSGPLSEAVLLGTVAYRTGKPLEWDAENLKATNAPEADQFIRREYRKGWEL